MKFTLILCMLYISLCAGLLHAAENTVTQVWTINALLAGAYDGVLPCSELLTHGNLGLGTFDGLAGEMIVFDNTVYQVKADGKVYQPSPDLTTPFAAVVDFRADKTETIDTQINYPGLKDVVNRHVPNMNIFCAVKVQGVFSSVKLRSVPEQKKPFPPLVEVAKHQPVFDYKDIAGTLVGFRCPAFVKAINVPGFHLHFISDDREKGGHVLGFVLEKGNLQLDVCNKFFMILPEGKSDFERLDLSIDRQEELDKVEQ